ncbi:hypothetical protein [Streptomyces flavidovirens]
MHDLDAARPETRRDLVGMSERDLAARARDAPRTVRRSGPGSTAAAPSPSCSPAGSSPPTSPGSATTCSCGASVTRGPRTPRGSPPRSTAGALPQSPPPVGATVADTLAARHALDAAMHPIPLDDLAPADPDQWGPYGADVKHGPDGTEDMPAVER